MVGLYLWVIVPVSIFIVSHVIADKDFDKNYKVGGLIFFVILAILSIIFGMCLGG